MRPTRLRLAPALATAATLVPWSIGPVSGQGPPVATLTYTTPASPTAVAGRAGPASSTLSVQGSSGLLGIRELAWADTDAGLCRLAVAAGSTTDRWDACDGGAIPRGFRVEEGHLVGLRACTDPRDGDGGPLRGIAAVWALRPDRPDAGRGETTREAAGDRCRRWTDEVRCPAGTAGPRLRLHRARDEGRAPPVGLQLLCHRVELQCWDVGPDEVVTAAPAAGCRRPAAVGEGRSTGR